MNSRADGQLGRQYSRANLTALGYGRSVNAPVTAGVHFPGDQTASAGQTKAAVLSLSPSKLRAGYYGTTADPIRTKGVVNASTDSFGPESYGYSCAAWLQLGYSMKLNAILRTFPAPAPGLGAGAAVQGQIAQASRLLREMDDYCIWVPVRPGPGGQAQPPATTDTTTPPAAAPPTVDQQIATAVAPHVANEAALAKEVRGWKIGTAVVFALGVVGYALKGHGKKA